MAQQKGRAVDSFFRLMESQGLSLTYRDVRAGTDNSDVMPAQAQTETRFSRNVELKMPIVSAAMDRVTEAPMAIAMAKLGGLGIIHKALSPETQAAEIARVKFHLNGVIRKPITVSVDQTVESVLHMREEKGFDFRSFPVLDATGMLVGIVTGNDFDFCESPSSTIGSIMSTDLCTARPSTSIREAYKLMMREKLKVLPLVQRGKLAGLYTFTDVRRIIRGDENRYVTDANGQLRVGAAIGVGEKAFARLELLLAENVDVVVIDTAHGDSKAVYDTLREIKRQYSVDVVAGNISEAASARRLLKAGADGIKIGQGPGAICTTRKIAGIGRPQVTAVYSCEKAIRGSDVPLCADGGLEYSGDIPIALVAGADTVMMGLMLSGTEEAPGQKIFVDGEWWKEYRGMGSLEAMQESAESRDRYRQGTTAQKLVPEGVSGRVKYKGPVEPLITQYLGGLRAGMGYTGARTILELRRKGTLFRITQAGDDESHPHGVVITSEPPNYRR